MLYCRYRNGKYEADLPSGETISFEDMDEMIRFLEERKKAQKLVDHKEETQVDVPGYESEKKEAVASFSDKKKKIRIHKGTYEVEGAKIKKALA